MAKRTAAGSLAKQRWAKLKGDQRSEATAPARAIADAKRAKLSPDELKARMASVRAARAAKKARDSDCTDSKS